MSIIKWAEVIKKLPPSVQPKNKTSRNLETSSSFYIRNFSCVEGGGEIQDIASRMASDKKLLLQYFYLDRFEDDRLTSSFFSSLSLSLPLSLSLFPDRAEWNFYVETVARRTFYSMVYTFISWEELKGHWCHAEVQVEHRNYITTPACSIHVSATNPLHVFE